MTIRSLPAAPAGRPCAGVSFDLMPQAMERWNADIQAAAEDDKNTISILDAIGFDPWSGRASPRSVSLLPSAAWLELMSR